MMERTQSKTLVGGRVLYICKVCGKEGQHTGIRNHIEANHIEGIVIPCNQCEKTFRSMTTFRTHKKLYHKKSQSGYFSLCDKIVVEKS